MNKQNKPVDSARKSKSVEHKRKPRKVTLIDLENMAWEERYEECIKIPRWDW